MTTHPASEPHGEVHVYDFGVAFAEIFGISEEFSIVHVNSEGKLELSARISGGKLNFPLFISNFNRTSQRIIPDESGAQMVKRIGSRKSHDTVPVCLSIGRVESEDFSGLKDELLLYRRLLMVPDTRG